ncbi:MAG: DUF4031 domain-containing protein [Actinomycetota bacterium]|nr:DUF4031 domain-containing protein [Actinomycetota bacterium]
MTTWIDVPIWARHGTTFAHLVSDTSLEELHAVAARAGLHPRSFEGDHYDVGAQRYAAVVAAGATPTTGADLVRRLLASGLRLRKRRGDVPVARVHDVPGPGGGVMDVDLVSADTALDRGRLVAVAVVVDDGQGSFVLVHTPARDAWGPPGGGIEPGELPIEAAARELLEETGLPSATALLHPVGWERFTVRPDTTGRVGRWGAGPAYLQLYAATLPLRLPLAPTGADVDAALWVARDELETRCAGEFWWPLLERVLLSVPVTGAGVSPGSSPTS